MADQTEQMVLVAKLVDQVSHKLNDINRTMIATSASMKKAQGAAAEAAKTHTAAIELVSKSMRGFESAIKTAR